MSQKSKLRRRQRNRAEADREDDREPNGHLEAEAYFEAKRREWERVNSLTAAVDIPHC